MFLLILSKRFHLSIINRNNYHTSAVLLSGRKTGSNSLEPSVRGWSKSQKKRNAEIIKIKSSKVDVGKKKLKENAVLRSVDSNDFKDQISKLEEKYVTIFLH